MALDELVSVEEEDFAELPLSSSLEDESIGELDSSFSLLDVPRVVELELPELEEFEDSFAEQLDSASLSDDHFSSDDDETDGPSCSSALLEKLVSSGPLVDAALSQPENAISAIVTALVEMNL